MEADTTAEAVDLYARGWTEGGRWAAIRAEQYALTVARSAELLARYRARLAHISGPARVPGRCDDYYAQGWMAGVLAVASHLEDEGAQRHIYTRLVG